jgi:serine protease inhibitor ecotin
MDKQNVEGWGYSSMVEHLPSMCEALGSVLSTTKKQNKAKYVIRMQWNDMQHYKGRNPVTCYHMDDPYA